MAAKEKGGLGISKNCEDQLSVQMRRVAPEEELGWLRMECDILRCILSHIHVSV